jgi:hypothetical protein
MSYCVPYYVLYTVMFTPAFLLLLNISSTPRDVAALTSHDTKAAVTTSMKTHYAPQAPLMQYSSISLGTHHRDGGRDALLESKRTRSDITTMLSRPI